MQFLLQAKTENPNNSRMHWFNSVTIGLQDSIEEY